MYSSAGPIAWCPWSVCSLSGLKHCNPQLPTYVWYQYNTLNLSLILCEGNCVFIRDVFFFINQITFSWHTAASLRQKRMLHESRVTKVASCFCMNQIFERIKSYYDKHDCLLSPEVKQIQKGSLRDNKVISLDDLVSALQIETSVHRMTYVRARDAENRWKQVRLIEALHYTWRNNLRADIVVAKSRPELGTWTHHIIIKWIVANIQRQKSHLSMR